jgi:hypothetical protein
MKIRHILPHQGHLAAYITSVEPFGMIIPLTDRVLVSRERGEEWVDEIVGFIAHQQKYVAADEVDANTRFMGYINPDTIATMGADAVPRYLEQLVEWGKELQRRSAPRIIPAQVEALLPEPDFPDEEESSPIPPRKRNARGR